MASIIQQEEKEKNQASANLELTQDEENFLEKKILEILERNRRGEGYVQKFKKEQKRLEDLEKEKSENSKKGESEDNNKHAI